MVGGGKLFANVPFSWKKSFSQGVVIPHKLRNCSDCIKDILCHNSDKLVNRRKDISVKSNELKRQPPIDFGHMDPKYIIT